MIKEVGYSYSFFFFFFFWGFKQDMLELDFWGLVSF